LTETEIQMDRFRDLFSCVTVSSRNH